MAENYCNDSTPQLWQQYLPFIMADNYCNDSTPQLWPHMILSNYVIILLTYLPIHIPV